MRKGRDAWRIERFSLLPPKQNPAVVACEDAVLVEDLATCERMGMWQLALCLLGCIEERSTPLNASVYTAAIGACERAGFDKSILSYSAAVRACEDGDFRPGLAMLYGDAYAFTMNVTDQPENRQHAFQ